MSSVSSESPANKRRNLLVLLPLIGFLGLATLFLVRLYAGDPGRLPSALIGRAAPPTDLPPLAGLARDGKAVPGLSNATFPGEVTLKIGFRIEGLTTERVVPMAQPRTIVSTILNRLIARSACG